MSEYSLEDKNIDVEGAASNALTDKILFRELMDGVRSKDNTIRQNSFKILQVIAEKEPEFLYPHWDYFQEMLSSSNGYHQYIAIYILAILTSTDTDNKFEKIFDDYFGILKGEKAMTASHVAINSWIIAQNKPELKSQVIGILMNIDQIHRGKQKELIKAYAIESLRKIDPDEEDQEKIMDFVKSQLDSSSPKTRNMAQCFLDHC